MCLHVHVHVYVSVFDDRVVMLRDLVSVGQVRVIIVLSHEPRDSLVEVDRVWVSE